MSDIIIEEVFDSVYAFLVNRMRQLRRSGDSNIGLAEN